MADTELNLEAERAAYLAAFPYVHFSGAWTARNEQDFAVWIASANRAATKAAATADAPKLSQYGYVNFETLDYVVGFGGDRVPEGYHPITILTEGRAPAEDAREEVPDAWIVGEELFKCHDAIPSRLLPPLGNPEPLYRRRASSVPAIPGTGGEKEQWQPISSAPRDGSQIILTNGTNVSQGWFVHDTKVGTEVIRDMDGRYVDEIYHDGYQGWMDGDGGMEPEPTHWMPLPAAPSHPSEAKTCTCPSGDGSLRWPCQVHPLEAKAGEDA